MNEDGVPGQDDYGLPSVDIEIPDDARELDRDVLAYYREQRALRRQLRSKGLIHSTLRRYGTVRPMIAGFLVLALLSSVLLVLLSAGQFFAPRTPAPGGHATGTAGRLQSTGTYSVPGISRPASSGPTASAEPSAGADAPAGTARAAGPRLPDASIAVSGHAVELRSLTRIAIALIWPGCRCTTALRQLIAQAGRARVKLYLVGTVGTGSALPELSRLADRARDRAAVTAIDTSDALGAAYHPTGLTLLLVDSRGTVRLDSSLRPGLLERQLASLKVGS